MSSSAYLGIPLNGIGLGDLGGHYLGELYIDAKTGKRFRMCQLDTGTGTTVVGTTILIKLLHSSGNHWIVTDDASEATLQTTHPVAAGFAAVAAAASTAAAIVKGTSPAYIWVQTWGPVENDPKAGPTGGTLVNVVTNGDNDITAGDSIITTSADNTVDSVAAGTAVDPRKLLGYAVADDGTAVVTIFATITGG